MDTSAPYMLAKALRNSGMASTSNVYDPERFAGRGKSALSTQDDSCWADTLATLADRSLDPLFWRADRLDIEAWSQHIPFAHWLVCATAPRTLVELGTHSGVSYSAFCYAVVRAGLGTRCHAVDTWRGDSHAGYYAPEVLADLRAFHDERFGAFSTLLQCTFDEALAYIEDESVDLLHIDGLHTYDAVRHDFDSWLPKLSDRAVVLFHDINVRRDDFGVWRLWAELRLQYPAFEFAHGHGLGVLAVGKDIPSPIAALCELTDPAAIAMIRSRFARLGERWSIDTRERQLAQEVRRSAETTAQLRADVEAARNTADRNAEQLRNTLSRLSEVQQQFLGAREQAERFETQVALVQGTKDTLSDRAVELERLLAERGAEQARLSAEREAELARRLAEGQAEQTRLQYELDNVLRSTFWRLTRPARKAASIVPRRLRLTARHLARVAYWVLTPHRTRERIAFFRARREILLDDPPVIPGSADREALPNAASDDVANPDHDEGHDRAIGAADDVESEEMHPSGDGPDLQPEHDAYQRWIQEHDTLTDADRQQIRAHIDSLPQRPLISIVMPAYDSDERRLREAIASIRSQLYPHWELCIADDASPSPLVATVLEELAASDCRIKWTRRETNGHIAAATNSALELATGMFVAFMDHDDLLAEQALYEVAVELNAHPDADLIFSDEDLVDDTGRRYSPYFKPDWNLDLFLGYNMVNHLGVYRRALVERLGGMRLGFEGSQDYDLALRVVAATDPSRIRHIPSVLYHWRQSVGNTFSELHLDRCVEAGRAAIRAHLHSVDCAGAEVLAHPTIREFTRVQWPLPAVLPRVSIIVPTRDRADLLARCVSGVLHRTDYHDFELIIVDNDSVEIETNILLQGLAPDPRVRILPFAGKFNYSTMNNHAVELATGEIVVLLNNDIDVIRGDWLREMVSHLLRPQVAAVGAKLLYANNTIQHAGVALGTGGVAGHIGVGKPRDDRGYFGLHTLVREVSACTAACLALKREAYLEVGGLEETHLPVAFNDVDLCIRLRQRGYKIIWTPFAELYHLESATRGPDTTPQNAPRARREVEYMRKRWGMVLDADPFYNPNFSRGDTHFSLAFPPLREKPWRRRTEV